MNGAQKVTLEAKITMEKVISPEMVEALNDEETLKNQLIQMLNFYAEPDKLDVEITNYTMNLLN